jgi:hypothetical protein
MVNQLIIYLKEKLTLFVTARCSAAGCWHFCPKNPASSL